MHLLCIRDRKHSQVGPSLSAFNPARNTDHDSNGGAKSTQSSSVIRTLCGGLDPDHTPPTSRYRADILSDHISRMSLFHLGYGPFRLALSHDVIETLKIASVAILIISFRP